MAKKKKEKVQRREPDHDGTTSRQIDGKDILASVGVALPLEGDGTPVADPEADELLAELEDWDVSSILDVPRVVEEKERGRISGEELKQRLRQERREKRLKEKGY
jgi:hypothetical protein